MGKPRRLPVALTIAGSDSGGGAGIQADIKTFAALGVHGTTAITCVTAQNPTAVRLVHPCPLAIVREQLEAVFSELPPNALKTGMLFSARLIRAVAGFLALHRDTPLVVDPVMISTSGSRLLKPAALGALLSDLIPLATVVMPNLPEAESLLGEELTSLGDLRAAARSVHALFGCSALLKGGHLKGTREAVDVFYDGKREMLLRAPFIPGLHTHGTGCTYSAAVTALLARGLPLRQAIRAAKEYITAAIIEHGVAAGHLVLNHRLAGVERRHGLSRGRP